MDRVNAIRVKGVTKDFVLPHERKGTIKSVFTGMFGRRINTKSTTQRALQNISFDVKKGEFFGIVGRNGSGKSTLLKILAGIYQPTKGVINVNGKLVPFIELGVGFNPELTGRENVYLNGSILGFSEKEINANYESIVEFAELEQFMDQKLKNYSSGMQVRLAFACATKANADILLVDEVLAVGDADFQRKCFEYFKSLKRTDKTVVFVTHDMNAVREYCDRAILIDDSRIVAEGHSSKVANEYISLFIPQTTEVDTAVDQKSDIKIKGTGKVKVTKLSVNSPVVSKDQQIEINIFFKVEEKIEDMVIGFKLKDLADNGILGTNTKIEKIDLTGHLQPATKSGHITFLFHNMLNSGEYVIETQIASGVGEIFDWNTEAGRLRISTEKSTGYPVEPKYTVKLKK